MANLHAQVVGRVVVLAVAQVNAHEVLELALNLLGILNRAAEGHGTLHRFEVITEGSLQLAAAALGEAVPTAHQLRHVINGELVGLIGQKVLEGGRNLRLRNAQHQHLVIGQQALLHGLAEADTVEHRTESIHVIHGTEHGGLLARLELRVLIKNLGGSRHVDALAARHPVIVVNLHEVRLRLIRQSHAGRAVRLIANNQVELANTRSLSRRHRVNGVVGGEDHLETLIQRVGVHRGGQLGTVRRRGQLQILNAQVGQVGVSATALLLATHLGIGTHRISMERTLNLVRELRNGLRHERQGRHHEEHTRVAAILLGKLLGQANRGEGLAGTAGHNQLTAVVLLQTFQSPCNGDVLVRAELLMRLVTDLLLARVIQGIGRPVDIGITESLQAHALHGKALFLQHLLRVLRPLIGRGHDNAVRKRLTTRSRNEGIDMFLSNRAVLIVELALNGGHAAVNVLGHQVDANIAEVLAAIPVLPQVHLLIQAALDAVLSQELLGQTLQAVTLIARMECRGSKLVKQIVKGHRRLRRNVGRGAGGGHELSQWCESIDVVPHYLIRWGAGTRARVSPRARPIPALAEPERSL